MNTLDSRLRLLLKSLFILFVFNLQFSYISAQVTVTFYYDSVVQNYMVPPGVTTMTIAAVGGMGGGSGNDIYAAGYGASITGKCTVTPGHNLSIVVGQQGYTSGALNTGGGGGGSFVFDSNNATIFVIAGGGGGEGFAFTADSANGGNGGIIYNSPYTPTTSPQGCGAIVSGGHGGNRGTYSSNIGIGPGAGGTGWLTNGDSVGGGKPGDNIGPYPCGGGKDRTNHFIGGSPLGFGPDVNYGGYGGGGGGGYDGGGGGGGYNGGSGGNDFNTNQGGGGGGGGSYLHGTIVGTPTATNDSNGYVIISYTLPSLTVTAAATTEVACRSGNTGKATATASYGTSPYTYSWSNAQTNAVATGLSAGTYTITVTDNVSATATAAVTITQPAANLAIAITSHININCNGNSTGSATASAATGGTSPYTYAWTPGGGTGLTASNLTANTYTIKVTDSHGCTASSSVSITQPTAVGITIASHANINCYGNNTGSATANAATGGNSPYTYAWTPGGGTGLTAPNLTAGTYTITSTDTHGCTGTATVSVTQPTAAAVIISSETDVLCYGNNGSATASASGGAGSFTYIWNDASSTSGASLTAPAGSYTVTAKDANGCTATTSVTIGQPASAASVVISSLSNILCFGNNGSATASATGGTGVFTYSWNDANSSTGATLSVSAGTYTVTATDANGCAATTSVTITQPLSAVNVSISSESDALCYGNTGSALAAASGGTGAITYKWNDANSSAGASLSAIAGTYTVTAKDANGCTATASVTIGQPASTISIVITNETDALCFGSNGSATASASGGTGTITYKWNDANSTIGAGLSAVAGTYIVTAKDANGCTGTASVIIGQPASAVNVVISSLSNVLCYGNNGSATASAGGGTGTITYKWSDANSTNGATLSAPPGSYTVTAKDANGCAATAPVTITQPLAAVSVIISSETDALCFGNNGSATAVASGGTGAITYKWNDANSTAGATLSALAGTYIVTAKDANGCTATASVSIGQPASEVSVIISSETNATCYGSAGSATASASGGTGTITYKWNDANSTAGATLSALAGTYTVTAKDANGCTATASVSIGQPGAFTTTVTILANVTCNAGTTGNANANPSGGNSPYTYKWSNGTTTSISISNPTGAVLPAHAYTLTVTDNHGCTATATVTITQPPAIRDSLINIINANCTNNGSATLGVKYGTLPYTYSWAPGGMTTFTVSGLGAQTYTATVTDNHGCAGTAKKAVISNIGSTLRDSVSLITHVGCTGGNGGTLSVGTRGGLPPYTYLWSNGNTSYTASNLTAGIYSVTTTDNRGCSNVISATITQPATAISATQASITYPQCSGGKGTASVTASGGTPAYKYSWAPVSCTNASCTSLSAGTYTVTVSDAHSCKSLVTIVMTQPVAIRDTNVTALKVNVTCNGMNNGSATVGVKYGTSPYTYHWSDGKTTATASGLSAGVYSVTVTDIHGCSGTTATVTITQPAAALAATFGTITCSNNLVQVTVTASGGTVPYTYLWSPGGGTKATMSGLSQGIYMVKITDKHGCIDSISKNLTCAPARIDGMDKGTSTACCGGVDNISLYPNPNAGQFTLTGLEQGMVVEIYDYTGRKVSGITASDITVLINISDQANGVYLVRILDGSGNLVSRKKVVKTN